MVILFAAMSTFAQDYRMMFQSGTAQPTPNLEQFIAEPAVGVSEIFNGYYYRYLQFNTLPTQEQKNNIAQSGIILLDYMPRNAFMAAIPVGLNKQMLSTYNIRSVVTPNPIQKINRNLLAQIPEHAKVEKGMADIKILYYANIDDAAALAASVQTGNVQSHIPSANLITVRVPENSIQSIAALAWVSYIEAIAPPSTKDDARGRSLHRSNNINTDLPMGRHYNGSGVAAALADDGLVGPHIDFTGRLFNISAAPGGTHGDMTGGILAGAGNLNPTMRGMADGVELHVFDIGAYPQIVNAVTNNANLGTVVSSTSYSQGCNEYTIDTQFGDQTTRDNPQLLFVFSAGNNAAGNCQYGAGAGWGNITGGYKQGKNVIACANLDAFEVRDNTSSRGPASDGRIKPDISSNGKDQMSTDANNTYQVGGGTSAACPGIAGISTQLIQAYKQLNSAIDAPTALIKAVLLNGAEDIGNPGPDYSFGYGRVNALRSVIALENNTYFSSSLAQGATNTHIINVPSNVAQLKVLVYWHDEGGNPSASVSLVNDIDMIVTDPSATNWEPWILDPTPTVAAITSNATRGPDHLNNMEQVTIDNPASGSYTVSLNGLAIPSGPQEYYLVYEFRYDDITVTYPIGGEGFVPGETEVIRWDALRNAGTFTLEYSVDNGANWTTIANNIVGTLQQYLWSVPNNITDQAKVRVTRGSASGQNTDNFSIIGLPTGITVDWCCPDSIKLSWNAVTGATGYEISALGTQYMDSIAYSTTNSVIIPNTNPNISYWFSVRALLPGGKGRRAVAIIKNPGTFNCPLAIDAELVQLLSPGSGTVQDCQGLTNVPVTISVENNGQGPLTNIPVYYSVNGAAPVADIVPGTLNAGQSTTFTFASSLNLSVAGNYSIDVWTGYTGDMNLYNDSSAASTNVVSGVLATAPYSEDFETFALCPTTSNCETTVCAPLNGWIQDVNLSQDDIDFRTNEGPTPSAGTGPDIDHTLGTAAGNYMYLEASNGCFFKTAHFITPCIDLTGITQPQLSFWYHMLGGNMGDLHVDVFSNGAWVNDVTPVISGNQGAAWLQRVQSLSAYAGQIINIRFRGITGNEFESDLAIDDIGVTNVTGLNQVVAQNALVVYPNPTRGIFNVSVAKPGNYQLEVFDINGKIVTTAAIHAFDKSAAVIDMTSFAKGVYTISVKSDVEVIRQRITIM